MVLGTHSSKVIDGSPNVRKERPRDLRSGRSGYAHSGAAKQKNAKAECYAKGYPVGEKNETPRTRHGSCPLVDTNNRLRVPV